MKTNTKTVVKVVQPEEPIATEIMADAIVAISQGIKKLRRGRLNDDALVMLIAHACPSAGTRRFKKPVTNAQVRAVLRGIESLEKAYLK